MARTSPSKVAKAPDPAAKTERRKRPRRSGPVSAPAPRQVVKARRKFLTAFPGGFRDETYLDWERDYKWNAHRRWRDELSEATFRRMIDQRQFQNIASLVIGIESRTNLLFSFEKMALRTPYVRRPARKPSRPRCSTFCTATNRWKCVFRVGWRPCPVCRDGKRAY
jgi:hypothetical protein